MATLEQTVDDLVNRLARMEANTAQGFHLLGETDKSMAGRLSRMETRMLRGFDELGIDVKTLPGWISVDEAAGVITITSLHHSLGSIYKELEKHNVETGQGRYRVVYHNQIICYI